MIYENRIYQLNTKAKPMPVHDEWHEHRTPDNNQEAHDWLAKGGMKLDCRLLNFLNTTRRAARLCDDISGSFCQVVDPSVKGPNHYIEFFGKIMYQVPGGFESGMRWR